MSKLKQLSFIILSLGFLLHISGCEREWSNPYDDKSAIAPEAWTPANLTLENISIISKKLTWSYNGFDNIEGFKIDRKEGDAEWQLNYLVATKDARQIVDTMIVPSSSLTYSYRLFAFAGNNASGNISLSTVSANIPPPSNVVVSKITDASYKVTWEDSITGEHGFKIDRRRENEEWEIAYGSVPANHTEFTDENVFSGKSTTNVSYRVYAWCREYESAKVSVSTEVTLTPPEFLHIIVNHNTSLTLNWQYPGSSHQGFKIDRRVNEGNWQEAHAALNNVTSYTDTDVNLADNCYTYRVYAYNNTINSAKIEHHASTPIVTTNSVSSITHESATCEGNVTNEGGLSVTARGLVWGTTQNPTTESNTGMSDDGSGAGSFTGNITGLQNSTVYYVRAYATNSAGTAYGIQHQFTTLALPPTVITTAISNITGNSATGGGNVTSDGGTAVTDRGVVWSTSQNPTTGNNTGITNNGSGTGSFTSNLTGLLPGTTYYVRAFATNNGGTAYGIQLSFTTTAIAPTVNTIAISSITSNSATSGGNVTSDGGATITARGIVWSTSQNPTVSNNTGITNNGSGIGSFTSYLTGLSSGTTYYVRAYATNSAGTTYGNQVQFITISLPTLTTTAITNITGSSATGSGNVTSDGGAPVTARGLAYGTASNPTIAGSTVPAGSGTGSFTANMTGLSPNTTYYVRAYATNSAGTAYGDNATFQTLVVYLPTVTTGNITNITGTSAAGSGNVTSDGGAPVTARGLAYGTASNPTIAGSTVAAGSGTGSFTANITGLTPNTTYHVRAYATNIAGTAYGSNMTFKTLFQCGANITFTYKGQQVTYGTVSRGGLCWMDRNLGASRVPISSTDSQGYGDLFQWGRLDDGHQNRTSGTTSTLSNSNVPGHGSFITVNSSPHDWRSPQNHNLWQGESGINNPCPSGWRLPTEAELNAERLSWSSNNSAGAYASTLKWPVSGSRSNTGALIFEGSEGYLWSSSASGTGSSYLRFYSSSAFVNFFSFRASGMIVRCVKD